MLAKWWQRFKNNYRHSFKKKKKISSFISSNRDTSGARLHRGPTWPEDGGSRQVGGGGVPHPPQKPQGLHKWNTRYSFPCALTHKGQYEWREASSTQLQAHREATEDARLCWPSSCHTPSSRGPALPASGTGQSRLQAAFPAP